MVTIQRRNLIPNPSFEVGIAGCSVVAGTGGTAAVSRQTSGGYSGAGFLRAAWTVASTGVGYVVVTGPNNRASVTPLGLVRLSAWVRPSVAGSWRLIGVTATTNAGGTTTTSNGALVTCPADVWTELTTTLTPASGRLWLEVRVGAAGAVPVGNLDVDAVLASQDAETGPYFDGSFPAVQVTPDGASRVFAWTGAAHASSSTQTLTDPLISVARLSDDGPPQAGVTLTGTGPVLVEVSADEGRSWEKVRDGEQTLVGGGLVRDHIPPLNVPALYRVTMGTETYTASITIPSDVAWMQDPLNPRAAVPVTWVRAREGIRLLSASFGEMSRPQAVDYATPMGEAIPVASIGRRSAPRGVPLRLRAVAAAQGELVRTLAELLDEAGVVVLRGLPADIPLPAVVHVTAPDVQESPVVNGVLGAYRDWVMAVDQVRAPAARIAVPWWTYDQVKAAWVAALGAGVSYDAVKATRPGWTYLDWLAEPTPD